MPRVILRFWVLISFTHNQTEHMPLRTIQERIESRIISRNGYGCWLTTYTRRGRPQIFVGGKTRILSRVVYEVYKGVSPGDLFVCHNCDNRHCINPEHLFLGTHTDNMLDRDRKNRQPKGSAVGNSKLTESQVMEIRDLLAKGNLTGKQIGDIYNVHQCTISYINTGKTWTHIDGVGAKINTWQFNRKLDDDKVKQIKKLLAEGMSSRKISELFGVGKSTLGSIRQNRTWTHINPE